MDPEDEDRLPDRYVRLISSDGFEFIITKEHAMTSNLLRSALESASRGFQVVERNGPTDLLYHDANA